LERAFARSERAGKQFGRNMENAGRGAVAASVGFHGLGRAVGYASASFLGAAGFVGAVKAGFDEMAAGEAVAADTAAAIKSTGGVAGVTAKQIDTMAGSLQRLTGYDDEAIASAENLILTFTNVRNVVGQGNDVFNQATKATLDLSRRFHQDLETSAVQLGKALQDPIRGVTALRRAGISFSTAQQRMINRLVSTGNVLEAQKIILQEVRTEVGGAAEAYGKTTPGQIDILRENVKNFAGDLAEILNPTVKEATERLNKFIEDPAHKTAAQNAVSDWAHGLGIEFRFIGDQIGRAIDLGKKFNDAKVTTLGVFGGDNKAKGDFGPGRNLKLGRTGGDLETTAAFAAAAAVKARPRGAKPPGSDADYLAALAKAARERRARMTTLRNTWFDATIGRELVDVQDIQTIRGRVARLKEISAQITAQIAVTKDITRKLNLEDTVKDIGRRRRGLEQDMAEQTRQAREAQKERLQQQRELVLDWLDFRLEKAQATKPFKDDLEVERARIAAIRKQIKAVGLTLDLARRLFYAQQDLAETVKAQAGQSDPLAGLMQVSSKRLTAILAAGTGLGAAGRRVLGANIAGAELQPLHVHVNIDGREVGRAVTKDQARTSRRTARQTSGHRG